MAKQNDSGNPEENEKDEKMNFEFIDESEIESVKRGRKAIIIEELVAFMNKAKVGQIVKVQTFAIPSEMVSTIEGKKAKASNASIIRSQAKAAGWAKVSIQWDVNGVPFAKRIA